MMLLAGCEPLHYSLRPSGGRLFLLPPKVTAIPAGPQPENDCKDPLSPGGMHYSEFGCYPRTGYVDLKPGMRIKVVSPVTASGAPLKTEVVAQKGLSLAVKTNATGVTIEYFYPVAGKPFYTLPAELRHFRLFLQARLSAAGDRNITLIGHAASAGLEAATANVEAYCRDRPAACVAVSAGMVIAPEISVFVNGESRFVPLGATVGELLPERFGELPPSLRILRPWKGKPAPVEWQPALARVRGLPLNPGDRVSW